MSVTQASHNPMEMDTVPSDYERHRTPAEPATLDCFTPFPKLPIELRRMIWKTALPPPRLVSLNLMWHEEQMPGLDPSPNDPDPPFAWTTTYFDEYLTPPEKTASITLSINQESRNETRLYNNFIFSRAGSTISFVQLCLSSFTPILLETSSILIVLLISTH